MRNILLVGRAGFIGSYLYEKLINKYLIRSLDKTDKITESSYYSVDLTDKKKLSALTLNIPRCDVLIFLVGLAHKKGNSKDISEFREINNDTLVNLLSCLKKDNKLPRKIIFASTISVYGERMNQNIYLEEDDKKPLSPYGITKLEAEHYLLQNYSKQSWILRFAPVYGRGFLLNIKRRTKVFGWFYKINDGDTKLSLCGIKNIGTVVSGIIEQEVPPGVYNIADEETYNYNDLLKYMDAKLIFSIPKILIRIVYFLGVSLNNVFLTENSIKLLTNNIFPSLKIQKHIRLSSYLKD